MSVSRRHTDRPRGVTLVELLVAMAIVAILASTVLFAMIGARESARKAKTRSMIATLNSLLMERWESYAARRVQFSTLAKGQRDAVLRDDPQYVPKLSLIRLNALRELMKLDLPDRWTDVTNTPKFIPRTALSQAYLRRYSQMTASPAIIQQHQGAECLYMIITLATGDGEARSHFSESDIADTDGDGAPEFLDGWGKPISFLRWPAGFVSEKQPLFNGARDPSADHDPFDSRNVDTNAYRLVPLIYSAGPDGEFDIAAYPNTPQATPPAPYAVHSSATQIGAMRDATGNGEAWLDNIHNHLIGQR